MRGLTGSIFCENGIVLIQVEQGETASYTIAMGDESASGELDLNFESYAPNGEGCDPICYIDDHTISLFTPLSSAPLDVQPVSGVDLNALSVFAVEHSDAIRGAHCIHHPALRQ